MAEENGHNLNTSFFLIVGFILVVGVICVIFWVPNLIQADDDSGTTPMSLSEQFHKGSLIRLTRVPVNEGESEGGADSASAASQESAVDVDPELASVIAAVDKGGCVACHVIPGVPNAIGQVGPDLSNIGVDAATRIEGYSAEEYIRESLQQPNAFTAPECPFGPCPPGAMPQLQLTDSEIETLVTYLLTLGEE